MKLFGKKSKVLAAAIAMMTLSTAAAVTGTVAWFSANNAVNINGMTVSTKVDGNLFIATDNSNDASYQSTDLTQTVSGKVEPVSTVNATNWYYTKDKISGTGAATNASVFQTYDTDAHFQEYYGINDVVPYVDYAFYIKATSSAAGDVVALTKCELVYNDLALGVNDLAWRVAVYSQPVAINTNSAQVGTNISILKRSDAAYFDGKAVSSVTDGVASYSAVSNLSTAAVIGTLSSIGQTQRYKVVVRLFLEGNDTKCNNETYVALTSQYKLSLTCSLGATSGDNAITPVTAISTLA